MNSQTQTLVRINTQKTHLINLSIVDFLSLASEDFLVQVGVGGNLASSSQGQTCTVVDVVIVGLSVTFGVLAGTSGESHGHTEQDSTVVSNLADTALGISLLRNGNGRKTKTRNTN